MIPDEPSPKKRGPQAKLGLASHVSLLEPPVGFNISMATSGSNGNARQSGRKRKTLAYDEVRGKFAPLPEFLGPLSLTYCRPSFFSVDVCAETHHHPLLYTVAPRRIGW